MKNYYCCCYYCSTVLWKSGNETVLLVFDNFHLILFLFIPLLFSDYPALETWHSVRPGHKVYSRRVCQWASGVDSDARRSCKLTSCVNRREWRNAALWVVLVSRQPEQPLQLPQRHVNVGHPQHGRLWLTADCWLTLIGQLMLGWLLRLVDSLIMWLMANVEWSMTCWSVGFGCCRVINALFSWFSVIFHQLPHSS